MAKPIKALREGMSAGAVANAEARGRAMLLEMDLRRIRENIAQLNQTEVAEILSVTQAHVSKLERRGDMLLSTLTSYVEALGGELEISARFGDDRVVRVTTFEDLAAKIIDR